MLQTATNASASATRPRTVAGALDCPAATALAACEPQGLDGAAVGLGGTMKAAVVKRWRGQSELNVAGAVSRWRFYAFGALSISTVLAACEPQVPGGFFREARSGEAVAESERAQLGKSGKPMAVLCLRRSDRGVRASDGAGLAGAIASAVTERSSGATRYHMGQVEIPPPYPSHRHKPLSMRVSGFFNPSQIVLCDVSKSPWNPRPHWVVTV